MQRWGLNTVFEVWLGVLNGTWVEVAEADAQEVRDFLWPHDGLVLTPHLCFVLRLSDGLSQPCDLSCIYH